jgi:60 kDa SS-A/Ro ribonucleoprotein
MPVKYVSHVSTKKTPQSQPILGKSQVKNSAGGFVFELDDWARLERFLILGNEGGTYYASEKKLTVENAEVVVRLLKIDGKKVVDTIVQISDSGRAPKNDPAIFALAMCAGLADPAVRSYALSQMPKVCRIGTHLFQFVEAVKQFRGWGRSLKRGIANWYETHKSLPLQLVKYQNRNGWSHRDVLRLCHLKDSNSALMRWAIGKDEAERKVRRGKAEDSKVTAYEPVVDELPSLVQAFEELKKTTEVAKACRLITTHNLPRECVPTQLLTEAKVWEALLENMPLTAMIRNLATMTRVGLISPMSKGMGKVLASLGDMDYIRKSRVHPITILSALLTYKSGHGDRGSNTWAPVQQIVDALDGAFYKAFGNVKPTGKRFLLACDVSGSMDSGAIAGIRSINPRVATGALALVTAAVEPMHHIIGFTSGVPGEWIYGSGRSMHPAYPAGITEIGISPRQRLDDVCHKMRALPMGGTDCALPMLYAEAKKMEVDTFVVLTDNETWAGNIHPCQALQQYRKAMGIQAKLVVVGMTATAFSIADKTDGGMLDVVGMDTSTPQLISDF